MRPMPSAPTRTTVAECVVAVERFFHPLLQTLRGAGDAIAPLFDHAVASEQVVRAVRPLALDVLADGHAVGAGFVVTPGLPSDETYLLAWWQGDDHERLPQSPALVQSTDYSRQEWFRTPHRTGTSHVTGPYVDYVCTDELTLTVTVPVVRGGRMLGVVGADILAETVEQDLLPVFARAGATLVNHHDRAVLSAQPQVFAGEPVDRSGYGEAQACTGLPFVVLA